MQNCRWGSSGVVGSDRLRNTPATRSYSWKWVFPQRGWGRATVECGLAVFFSTLLWPNDRFYAWQTDWLRRFQVCWETRAVNKKSTFALRIPNRGAAHFPHVRRVLLQRWDTEYRTSLGTECWQRKCTEVHLANLQAVLLRKWSDFLPYFHSGRSEKSYVPITKAIVLVMAERLMSLLSFNHKCQHLASSLQPHHLVYWPFETHGIYT